MKYLLLICLLLVGLKAWSQQRLGPHEAALAVHVVPFFIVPAPVGVQVSYANWAGAPHGIKAGLAWFFRGSDGQDLGLSLQYGALLGRGQHFFEPSAGLFTAFSWDEVEAGGRVFRRRKWGFTPQVDLMYRLQFPGGFFLRAGLATRTPPVGEIIIQNDFIDDARYDGPPLRMAFQAGGGLRF